jgi:hypothetical protein
VRHFDLVVSDLRDIGIKLWINCESRLQHQKRTKQCKDVDCEGSKKDAFTEKKFPRAHKSKATEIYEVNGNIDGEVLDGWTSNGWQVAFELWSASGVGFSNYKHVKLLLTLLLFFFKG